MMLYLLACTVEMGLAPSSEFAEALLNEDELSVAEAESGEEIPATETDIDGDGFSVEDGDCSDDDAAIFPGQIDWCDGIDNDCDAEIDEDAGDTWEPNDEVAYFDGLYEGDDRIQFEGVLTTDSDVDRFQWYLTDPIGGYFQIQVLLDGPYAQTDYIVELWLVEDHMGNPGGLLQTVNNGGYGEGEILQQDGVPFFDDAGLYEVVVYAFDGGGCESNYNLEISFTN